MRVDPEAEIKQVLAHYDLGELVAYTKDTRGYVNVSYTIETRGKSGRQKYFLRKYKSGVQEEELKFEHSIIHHLLENKFDLVAQIYTTKEGNSYVKKPVAEGEEDKWTFFAIFEFLKGEDRFTWINPICNPAEIKSAASVLAGYHAAIHGFTPQGRREEAKIIDLLPRIKENLLRFLEEGKLSKFSAYIQENLRLILDLNERTLATLEKQDPGQIVELVIHCDYHPGNLKFEGNQVVGLFDFDWTKIDARGFDVALALKYFFSNWQAEMDGSLRLADIALFLGAYQGTLDETPGLGRLNPAELSLLPHMIMASALYIFYWTILDITRMRLMNWSTWVISSTASTS
ncbi:MAG: phosphotransferase [Anaerolineales bacterium]